MSKAIITLLGGVLCTTQMESCPRHGGNCMEKSCSRPGRVTPCPRATAICPTEHIAEACTSGLRHTQLHTLLRVTLLLCITVSCLPVFPVIPGPLEGKCFVLSMAYLSLRKLRFHWNIMSMFKVWGLSMLFVHGDA